MRSISLFFSLLLAWSCWAQPSPINRRAFALSGLASTSSLVPSNILSGMYFWWTIKDLADGITVTAQWLDRIQSIPMAQGNATVAPTNAANLGVWFGGTSYLTNLTTTKTSWAGSGTPSLVFILLKPYVQSGDAVAIGQSDRGFGVNTTPNLRYAGDKSGGPNTICPTTVSNMFDVYVYLTSTNTTWFTNSIPVRTNASAGYDFIATLYLGRAGSGGVNYKGFLEEHGCWTNVSVNSVYSKLPDLHQWITNNYGTNVIGTPGVYP